MRSDRSPTPSEREMVLFRRPLGSGNSFKRSPVSLPKQNTEEDQLRVLSTIRQNTVWKDIARLVRVLWGIGTWWMSLKDYLLPNPSKQRFHSPRSLWIFAEARSCKLPTLVRYHRISLLQKHALLPPIWTYLAKLHRVLSGTSEAPGSAILKQQRLLRLRCAKGADRDTQRPLW